LGLHENIEYCRVFRIMRTNLDCIPCFVRQTLDAARIAGSDQAMQERIMRHVLPEISRIDMTKSPPEMAQVIHRIIRDFTGCADPYRAVKDRFNEFALKLYPSLKQKIEESSAPLETAARLAIAGNIIDFGVNGDVDVETVLKKVEQSLVEPLWGDMALFVEEVSKADNILYLADNTGEIVFDRLLIEALPLDRVTLAVRGAPIINDATIEDARAVGLADLVPIIDNGADLPGIVLFQASDAFVQTFKKADMIIAKGQGNYETLSGTTANPNIFFLFQTKCQVAARDVGCKIGRFVLKRI